MFSRIKLLVIVGFIMLGLSPGSGFTESIPLPPNTEEVNKEARKIAGSEFEFIYYTNTEHQDAIKDFYRRQLPNYGWKEKEIAQDLQQVPGFKMDASVAQILGQNLVFEKDGILLIINFMPEGFFSDTKTYFALGKAKEKIEPATGSENEKDMLPELLKKPRRDIAPVYPGSSLMNLSEQPHSQITSYITKDDIEQVASFYKEKMPGFGWFLVAERPLEEADYGDLSKYDISKYCPNCPKEAIVSPGSIETWVEELDFTNQRGDTCHLVLSQTKNTAGGDFSLDMTTILVDYEEKKE